jgi:shikimate kinase
MTGEAEKPLPEAASAHNAPARPLVLLGMMGAGKSSLGGRLAKVLKLPFHDADAEVEKAAGMPIADIFANHGEAAFRDGERRVIKRLVARGPQVLALGGGAFMDAQTRELLAESAITIWLDVPIDELERRVNRKPGKRPLLAGVDIRQKLETLMQERAPVYAGADIRIALSDRAHDAAVTQIIEAVQQFDQTREA